jgi:hypothetical protein
MRSKLRIILAVLVATSAFAAVASASASAASSWWVAGEALKAPSAELASAASVTSPITLSVAGVVIRCSSQEVKLTNASIAPASGGKIEHLVFNGCTVPAGECNLASTTIESKPLTMEAELGSKSPEDTILLKPATKTLFAEYEFTGSKCSLAGVVQLTGTDSITLPKGREELATQEVSFNNSAHELKWGSAAVLIEGNAKAKLVSGKAWSFH